LGQRDYYVIDTNISPGRVRLKSRKETPPFSSLNLDLLSLSPRGGGKASLLPHHKVLWRRMGGNNELTRETWWLWPLWRKRSLVVRPRRCYKALPKARLSSSSSQQSITQNHSSGVVHPSAMQVRLLPYQGTI